MIRPRNGSEGATGPQDERKRLSKAQRLTIGSIRHHRIEGVRHLDDSSLQGNRISRQAVRVPLPVEALVVVENDLLRTAQEVES